MYYWNNIEIKVIYYHFSLLSLSGNMHFCFLAQNDCLIFDILLCTLLRGAYERTR